MSAYRTVFHAKAATEVRGIPERAAKTLYDTLVTVARDPWAATTPDPVMGDDAFRFALFDNGDGVVHVRIHDHDRTVVVHGIVWLG